MVQRRSPRKKPDTYRSRSYRHQAQAEGLVPFSVTVRETDLHILATRELRPEARQLVLEARSQLETYITTHTTFLASLTPLPDDPTAPPLAKEMLRAATAAGVGPMASVAGVIAEYVGRGLLAAGAGEVLVENGGDIFLHRDQDCLVRIFAGESPLSNRIVLRIDRKQMPSGVCTSSGAVGHSLSQGRADAATVVARSTALADAAATALGNMVRTAADLNTALEAARNIPGIQGAVLIHRDKMGAWGDLRIEPMD